jgi:hypothetical protein
MKWGILPFQTGKLLQRLIGPTKRDKASDFTALSTEERKHLMTELGKVKHYGSAVIDLIAMWSNESDSSRHDLLKRLLRVIGTSETVTQFLRYPTPIVVRLLANGNVAYDRVRHVLPILSPLLSELWPQFNQVRVCLYMWFAVCHPFLTRLCCAVSSCRVSFLRN